MKLKCPICGKEFTEEKIVPDITYYCSHECAKKSLWGK